MIRIVTEKIANRIFGVLCGISLRPLRFKT
jgi:hypothetical protein